MTYSKDIAPILQKNCVNCHRPGQIAPFALTEYADVAAWADTMLEVIDDGRMPRDGGGFGDTRRCESRDDALEL